MGLAARPPQSSCPSLEAAASVVKAAAAFDDASRCACRLRRSADLTRANRAEERRDPRPRAGRCAARDLVACALPGQLLGLAACGADASAALYATGRQQQISGWLQHAARLTHRDMRIDRLSEAIYPHVSVLFGNCGVEANRRSALATSCSARRQMRHAHRRQGHAWTGAHARHGL